MIVRIDLNQPMAIVRAEFAQHPATTRRPLSGPMVVAHDKLKERVDSGKGLPGDIINHPVSYAVPARTPKDYASGRFESSTAGLMDSYIDFQYPIATAKSDRASPPTGSAPKSAWQKTTSRPVCNMPGGPF